MDAVIYVRWSSAEQSRGSSRARQIEDCRKHATSKGWRIVAELEDEGISAFNGKNVDVGKLGKFIASVKVGAYPEGVVLLTEKLDRLSREDPGTVFIWMMEVTGAGVVIATVDGDRQYRTGQFDMAGIIEVVVKAQLAHEESLKKADRLAAAWRKKRDRLAEGKPFVLTRRTPAWIEVIGEPPATALIEERATVVRRIFEETVAGYGKHTIARRLNQEGVETFGRASGWHPSYIQKILTSTTVLGEMQPSRKARGGPRETVGDPVVGYYPAAVDADLHARARQSMAGRSRRVTGRGRSLVNIFSGLAKCSQCGERMTFRGKGGKVRADGQTVNEDYLVCDSYQRGRGCPNGQHFNYLAWETAILNAVLTQAMGDEHFASQKEVHALEVEHADAIRRREAAKRRADKARSLLYETDLPEVKADWLGFKAEIAECEKMLAIIKERIMTARGAVSPAEHQKRISDLFDQMIDNDDQLRFEARSRVMEAIHELIGTIRFNAGPHIVEVVMKNGLGAAIECVSGRGPDARFFYRYDPGFFG